MYQQCVEAVLCKETLASAHRVQGCPAHHNPRILTLPFAFAFTFAFALSFAFAFAHSGLIYTSFNEGVIKVDTVKNLSI